MSDNEFYEFTFDWTIENFSQCFKKNGKFFQSPIFCPDCLGGSKWCFRLYPKGNIECEYISFFLSRCDDQMNEKKIFLEQKWELIGVDEEILNSILIGNNAYEKNQVLGQPQFMKCKIIHDKIKEWNEDKVTFRCHIRRSEPQICKAITKINVDHYVFQWIMAKPNSTDWIESKQISFQESLKFQIDITAPEDDVLIKVNKLECLSAIFMRCQISLIYRKGNKIKTETSEHIFDSSPSDNIWNFPPFIKKSQLEEEKDSIFKDDTFTLEWKFSYSKDTESYIDYSVSTLKDDLGKMLKTEKHCDVQLRSKDGILSAHKSVLSSRSSVFSAMFDQNMIENKSGIVEIDDCDSNTLKIFLNYVYNDVLELNDSTTALNLLLTAEKYQVQTLEELCCPFLISNLAVENVCDILAIADMIGHKHLKSSALNYIKSNSKKVFSSPEGFKWVENNPKLATEILCFS